MRQGTCVQSRKVCSPSSLDRQTWLSGEFIFTLSLDRLQQDGSTSQQQPSSRCCPLAFYTHQYTIT